MTCSHGVEYPLDGENPEAGPWHCNPDGSNPNCPNCDGDAWAKVILHDVELPFDRLQFRED